MNFPSAKKSFEESENFAFQGFSNFGDFDDPFASEADSDSQSASFGGDSATSSSTDEASSPPARNKSSSSAESRTTRASLQNNHGHYQAPTEWSSVLSPDGNSARTPDSRRSRRNGSAQVSEGRATRSSSERASRTSSSSAHGQRTRSAPRGATRRCQEEHSLSPDKPSQRRRADGERRATRASSSGAPSRRRDHCDENTARANTNSLSTTSSQTVRRATSDITDKKMSSSSHHTSGTAAADAIAIANQRRAARKDDVLGGSRHGRPAARNRSDPLGGSMHRGRPGRQHSDPLGGSFHSSASVPISRASQTLGRTSRASGDPLGGSSHGGGTRTGTRGGKWSDPLGGSSHGVPRRGINVDSKASTTPRRATRREDALGGSRHGTRRATPSTPITSDRLQNLTMLLGDTSPTKTPRNAGDPDDEAGDEETDDGGLGDLLTSSDLTPGELQKVLRARKGVTAKKNAATGRRSDGSTSPKPPCGGTLSPLPPLASNASNKPEGRPPFSPPPTAKVSSSRPRRSTMSHIPQDGAATDNSSEQSNVESSADKHGVRRVNSLGTLAPVAGGRSSKKTTSHSVLEPKKYVGRTAVEKKAKARAERRNSVKSSLFSMLDGE